MPLEFPTPPRPRPDQLAVLVIDVQPRFLQIMAGDPAPVLLRIEQLLRLAGTLALPLIATIEEPVDAKGELPPELSRALPEQARTFRKWTYDCCAEPEIKAAISSLGGPQIAVAGAESDVCVLQTVLSLVELGLQVFLVEDCIFSSAAETGAALERMKQAGATFVSYKTLYYELFGRVRTEPQPEGLLTPLEL